MIVTEELQKATQKSILKKNQKDKKVINVNVINFFRTI